MKRLPLLLAVALLLTACAPQLLYYYGDSSSRYYKAVRKQDEASVRNYKRSLEDVFRQSERYNIKVPPGLYCDYAMLLLAEQDLATAREYILKEKQTWPESAALMDFLLQRHQLAP